MRDCVLAWCAGRAVAKGLCERHYRRMRRTGSIEKPSRQEISDADRFWARVRKGPGCWEWQGGSDRKGYGAFSVSSARIAAHRFAWELEHGPIPDGLHVLHTVCDNPRCVRASHLKLGTNAENQADRAAKGRSSKHGKWAWVAHREGKTIAEVSKLREAGEQWGDAR